MAFLIRYEKKPNYARLLMMAQRESPEFYGSDYYTYVKKYTRLILETIVAGQGEGIFRRDISPRLIKNMAMGTSVFTTFDSIANDRPYDPHEHSDLIYQLVVNAVGGGPPLKEKAPKEPNKGRAEYRKAQILETSTRVFANSGFSVATISEIAGQANLGDATLYGYFENKEAILLGISEKYMQELVSEKDIIFDDLPGTEKRLRKLIWRWVWQLRTHEDFARILVLELFRNWNFYSSPGYKHFATFLS